MVDYATLNLRLHTEPFRSLIERLICYFLNIHLSTQKNIRPPIKLATIVAHSSPRPASHIRQIASIGVESCQRIRQSAYFFIVFIVSKSTLGGARVLLGFKVNGHKRGSDRSPNDILAEPLGIVRNCQPCYTTSNSYQFRKTSLRRGFSIPNSSSTDWR